MLGEYLHKLPNIGESGFEGLVARLLRDLTGFEFHLARSGSQHGRDAEARPPGIGSVMFECKNYLESTKFDERALVGQLTQALLEYSDLDIWILATSRSIPIQLLDELESVTKGLVDILPLSCEQGDAGNLDILCAAYPRTVLSFMEEADIQAEVVVELRSALLEISERSDFSLRKSVLRKQLEKPSLAWPAWRRRSQSSWMQFENDREDSRHHFGQVLDVESPESRYVDREIPEKRLDQWWGSWPTMNAPLVVLGEEGHGKSWIVAKWITRQVSNLNETFPPIVFLSSRHASGEPLIEDLISKAIARSFSDRDGTASFWKEKISRWCANSDARGAGPLAVLVFDGLNERHDDDFWRRILEGSNSSQWRGKLAIICTVRKRYWQDHFGDLDHLRAELCEVDQLNDSELSSALSLHGRTSSEFSSEVIELMRKPRVLDLAIQHHERLMECGDFTPARLVYEDWKDRCSRKSNPISSAGFNDFLRNVASRVKGKLDSVDRSALETLLPHYSEREKALEELISVGVLSDSLGKVTVAEPQLTLGLALLLCDILNDEPEDTDLYELIARWVENYKGSDLVGEILENAALHSLIGECSGEIRVALLRAWLESQNPPERLEQPIEGRFTAYLPQRPESYFALAEVVWSDRFDHPWGQEVLLHGFIRWSLESKDFRRQIGNRLQRWLGIIPKNGPPIFRESDRDSSRQKYSFEKLTATLGFEPTNDNFVFAGYPLALSEDDGHLRLSRVALAIISHFSRIELFVPALVTGVLAEALFDYPEKSDLFRWVIRKSTQDLSELFLGHVQALKDTNLEPASKAAARLCEYMGTAAGWREWLMFDRETLFPVPSEIKEFREKPYESLFQLKQSQIEHYTRMESFDPKKFVFIFGASRFSSVQTLDLDGDIGSKLKPLLSSVPEECSWLDVGKDIHPNLRSAKSLLARYCLGDFVDVLRRGVRTAKVESIELIRKLSFEFTKYELIFGQAERDVLLDLWNRKHQELLSSEDNKAFESYLFLLVLPLWSGTEQLDRFLNRDESGMDLRLFDSTFSADSPEMPVVTSDRQWARLLWYCSETKIALVPRSDLNMCLENSDSYVRDCAYRYLYVCATKEEIENWVSSCNWSWTPGLGPREEEIASQLMIEYAQHLPLPDLLKRLPPFKRGIALQRRSSGPKDWADFGNWLNSCLDLMVSFDLPRNLPKIEIDYSSHELQPPFVMSLKEIEDNGIHIVRPEAIWGGRMSDSFSSLFQVDVQSQNRQIKMHQRRVSELSEDAEKAGIFWMKRNFQREGLENVLKYCPQLISDWLNRVFEQDSDQVIYRAQPFYEALCEVLLKDLKWHERAAKLFRTIGKTDKLWTVVEPGLMVDHLLVALMKSPTSEYTKPLWEERLNSCCSDLDLLDFALAIRAARAEDSFSWISSRLSEDLKNAAPFYRARAFCMLAYLDEDLDVDWWGKSMESESEWIREVREIAHKRLQKEADCRFWFKEFCRLNDNDQAWGAFILFLESVDRRCWLWISKEVESKALSREKMRFLQINNQVIEKQCRKNEKKLASKFLDCKVDFGLSPWLWISRDFSQSM